MNQVATISERRQSIQAGGSIVSILPQNLDDAFRLSTAIHQAGMSPYGIDTPQKIMIAMLAGLELGMPPMQGVQSIAVINNRPCMWGDALIGVVRNSGVCQYVKEWMEGDGDNRIAYCETKRKGEDEPVRRSFSADDAKRAGLWQTEARVTKQGKNGPYTKDNDSPWYRYPQRMLQMRARAWCLRDVYPDVLKGMQSREEVEDYQHASSEPVEPQQSLPPLEERLRIAQGQASEAAQEPEGFDAAHVTRETAALTGEPASGQAKDNPQSSDTPTDDTGSDGKSPSPESAVAADGSDTGDGVDEEEGAPETHPDKPADGQQAAPSSEPIRTRADCLKAFMTTATDPDLDVAGRRDLLEQMKDWWKADLPNDLDFVKACLTTADKVAKGELGADAARKYLEGLL